MAEVVVKQEEHTPEPLMPSEMPPVDSWISKSQNTLLWLITLQGINELPKLEATNK